MQKDSFGATVRKRRRGLDLPQAVLAREIGRPQSFVSQLESGFVTATSTDRERIERALAEFEALRRGA